MNNKDLFIKSLEKLDISLQDSKIDQFIKYYDLLIEWNNHMNLTAITKYEEVINKHFIDSLSIIKAIDLNKNISLIDIGTGAGFPGIPLKISFTDLNVVLLDSLNKRISFLNEVINQLSLKNIKTIHGRAEDYGRSNIYRENYDICVSRAVAGLNTLSEYCIPFIKVGGIFISYKSGNIREELEASKKAIKMLGSEIEDIKEFILPNTDIQRNLIIIRKLKSTSIKYPRKAGKPSKEPII